MSNNELISRLKNTSKVLLVVLSCFFSFSVSAQKLYFCKGYSETGEPKSVAEDWAFDSKGTDVVFLYNNGKTTFSFASLFFEIQNTTTNTIDKKELKVAQNRNWDALKYTFREEGYYAVSVFGNDNKLLTKSLVKIGAPKGKETAVVKEVKKEEPEKKEVKAEEKEIVSEIKKEEPKVSVAETKVAKELTKEEKEVLYYDDVKVIFCEQMKEGKIVNEKSDFKMGAVGAYVEVVLQSAKPLNTDVLMVDIWKKPAGESNYTEHVDEEEIKLNSKNKQVNFHRSFFKPGEYKFSFFNSNMVWITTGYVTVTQ